jgi:hypothetical protein
MNSLAYLSNQALVNAVAHALEPGNSIRRKIEDRMRSLKNETQKEQKILSLIQRSSERGFRVINRDILYRVFMPFVDLILLNWEILTDIIIDDLITQEVYNLNSLENQSKSPPKHIPNPAFTLEKIEKIGNIGNIEKHDAKSILDFVKECKAIEEELLYKYS